MSIFRDSTRDSSILGAIDIGTAKVCCLIASVADGTPTLLGLGHQRSLGIKSGMVVNADEAERAVRAAVGQAERMAGVSLDRAVVAVGCGRIRAASFTARSELEGRVVRHSDLERILGGGEAYLDRSGRMPIQLMHTGWQLDGASGISDPRGLAGRELAVDLTAVTADDGPLRNLIGVIERGHMSAERLIAAPYASAIATATDEERRLGTLVVEMGAGLTSFAAFADGCLVHMDSVPVGGNHLTFDIARELVTSVREAERIKTLYGTLVKAASNDDEVFAYPLAGDDEVGVHQASRAHVREISRPRIEGLMDLILERLWEAGIDGLASRSVILTGGASQLPGLDQAWSVRFGTLVRIGRPHPIGRMPASLCSPAFSTVIGLVAAEAGPKAGSGTVARSALARREGGYLLRMQRWIRESF